ncbi:MAG: hypothetical protein IMF10_06660 [Proteobacteria bacterium]|nr:hypothetical protein [Pseudomonadota bacterium]
MDFMETYPEEIERLYIHLFGFGGSKEDRIEKIALIESGIDLAIGLMQNCSSVEDLKSLLTDDHIDMSFVRIVVLIITGRLNNLSAEQLDTLLTPVGWKNNLELCFKDILTLEVQQLN